MQTTWAAATCAALVVVACASEGPSGAPEEGDWTAVGTNDGAASEDAGQDVPADEGPVEPGDAPVADPGNDLVSPPDILADPGPAPADVVPDEGTPDPDVGTEPDVEPDVDDPDPPDPGEEINGGWIGGACEAYWDCDNPDYSLSPTCLLAGFPGGYCTQDCKQGGSGSWVCPDTLYGPGTGATMSRCITTADGSPTCVTECDAALSPTGCRPGYTCVLRKRHGEPDKIYPICLPSDAQGWPGEGAKGFDIGGPCLFDKDCEHLMCLQLPGGYCSKSMCDLSGCPTGSTCWGFEGSDVKACLDDCNVDGQCRTSEGYLCDDYGTCWPGGVVATPWDPTVSAGDCADAWSAGLSPCDLTPDDYVVINKSARNLALCHKGQFIAGFHMGLGFAPSGDKQVQGDGKTPEGVFYTAELKPNSQYYKAFLLSYPDSQDADWGYGQGLITKAERDAIQGAQQSCSTPPQYTDLGGLIEIHGEGGGQDWTWGCIAIENFELDMVWSALGPGDTIVVTP